ncbi:MAG TPA: VOC family protein [Vicinamibacterales bacterium]|jgi:catechol 2,3-dioxygenase|nr:VOC family protein [Vicinamibacterales bacterium]
MAIDPRVSIGHVHLKVADLDRAVAFYSGVLGFDIVERMGPQAAFLSAGGYHHHIGLNTWESRNGSPPPPGTTGLYHVAIRYPDRPALADALRRLVNAGTRLDGAADHGVSEALYLHDPDGNGIELYWDRPREEWPRRSDGSLRMFTHPLDVDALLADAPVPSDSVPPAAGAARVLTPESRARLGALRQKLLALHKALLEDAKSAYELDRGRISSPGQLLQLVINDPWFAWLHQISELIVRMDDVAAPNGTGTEPDALALFEQVDRLLMPSETGDPFARKYFEALQRQPAVVLAHGDVRKALREP